MVKAKKICSNRIVYGLFGYAVALAIQWALVPWNEIGPEMHRPYFATPFLMLLFGPYLLVPRDAWIGSGNGWWFLKVLPLYLVHLAFILGFLSRCERLNRGRVGRIVRWTMLALVACWSLAGIWYAVPVVERLEIPLKESGAMTLEKGPVRLAVVADLHSCRYGDGQRGLVEMIDSQVPDIVLMVGDIFDDKLPDGPAREFVTEMVKRYPCVYVSGNHEFWSDRPAEMMQWLEQAGVVVLRSDCANYHLNGVAMDFCGVDDQAYMEIVWPDLIRKAWNRSDPSHYRVLLTHRPEQPHVYEQFGFDLVLAGHAHGGQWRCPGLQRGVYSPDQGCFPRYTDGFYMLSNGCPMVVSRGLGRESTPIPRFFNHPHVLFVDLVADR